MKKTLLALGLFLATTFSYANTNANDLYLNNSNIDQSTSDNYVQDENDWTKKLDDYLENGKFASANKIIQEQQPAALIGRLRPWAEKNLTVAQWFYADALYKEQRFEDSAKWTFIAFFFTRYDASLCTNNMALNLEKPIVDSYREVVEKSRSDKETINLAVSQAIDYLKNYDSSTLTSRNPTWICDMVVNHDQKRIVVSSDHWDRIYKERLKQFIKTTTGQNYNIK